MNKQRRNKLRRNKQISRNTATVLLERCEVLGYFSAYQEMEGNGLWVLNRTDKIRVASHPVLMGKERPLSGDMS